MTEGLELVTAANNRLVGLLLNELNTTGYWDGELSSSALSTAVAAIALRQMDLQSGTNAHSKLVRGGLEWLARNANLDGGWGDTIRSKSNISTTALCWAAFGACDADDPFRETVQRAENWLTSAAGSLDQLPRAIAARYGKDRTFSVPILMTCALSGRLGPKGWRKVPALPFELALFPRSWFGALRLPVVSYALPALIAIGQVIHRHAPSRNPLARLLRITARRRTLHLLAELQPGNGGFLEATPLTAFVTMSLASAGEGNGPVAKKGAEFLKQSVRPDGSWPIDTNLATWVTTLSIKALSAEGNLTVEERERARNWLLKQQYKRVHPYTGAAPGGWAWTDLPGGVPDADDTAGALLALHQLGEPCNEVITSVEAGITWLLGLQNSDGGIPTFCRGWGTLPFDRSTPEITAHALRAWTTWQSQINPGLRRRVDRATGRAVNFLERSQRPNGSFVPLWFGNESGHDDENPVYGTAQVLIALNELGSIGLDVDTGLRTRAEAFLAAAQTECGGWGGDAGLAETLEETALALEALSTSRNSREYGESIRRGTVRLLHLIDRGDHLRASPIGFYFARLWYFEKLYPLIFSVSALTTLCRGAHLQDS